MKRKKDFSIVIAYYNNQTILNCLMWILDDLKNKKRYTYEIFVVDDSSKYPLSMPVLNFLDKNKIKYFRKKKNEGISEVRNTAIDITYGDIIVFLDSDCYVKKGYFDTLYNTFKKFINCGMVFGKREPYHDKPFKRFRELKYQYKSGKNQEKNTREFTNSNMNFYLVSGNNMAIKRNVLREIGYFIPNFGCEDLEMQYLIMQAGYSTVYNPKLVVFHDHPHKFIPYLKKAFKYGRGFQKFKDRQGIRFFNNKYYRVYMGVGKIFEKFGSLKGKSLKYKLEVWLMEITDYLTNKLARFIERHFSRKIRTMHGVYGVIYIVKNNKLKFLVAKYDDGYGLIGGRINSGESLREGFIRELNEEVGIKEKNIEKLFLTSEQNDFASNRYKGMERHHFFILKLNNKFKPIPREVNFKWLSYYKMTKLTKWVRTQKIINNIIKKIKEDENL
ncbi:glycosyltransferase [Candidatus Woesearchaeota archaeon]|nr:glycosyltransferase [Candidatus Woesearchaeota archaeon]